MTKQELATNLQETTCQIMTVADFFKQTIAIPLPENLEDVKIEHLRECHKWMEEEIRLLLNELIRYQRNNEFYWDSFLKHGAYDLPEVVYVNSVFDQIRKRLRSSKRPELLKVSKHKDLYVKHVANSGS